MKKLVTEEVILDLIKNGQTELAVSKNTIITPAARDIINSSKINIVDESTQNISNQNNSEPKEIKTIAIGSDHTGYDMKEVLKTYLSKNGYRIIDVGTNSKESCDYPDYALEIARKRLIGACDTAIMIDATGIPSAIVINKLPGIRAATCYNEFSAKSAREHNNACVLCVGAKSLGEETIKSIVDVFLKTPFAAGRHQRRLDKITAIEQKLLNSKNS